MRLFFAIDLPGSVKRALGQGAAALCAAAEQGRFVPEQNYHLTLAFIGESDRRGDLTRLLGQTEFTPFVLRIDRSGRFPGREGDVLWAGIESSKALADLHRQLIQRLERAGFTPESRRFSPHVTLARRARLRPDWDYAAWAARYLPLEWRVRELCLFRSDLGADGVRYMPVARRPS